jgi:hypothetical protein
MRWSVLFLLLVLAGCTPKFQPAANTSDTAMAQAEWDCRQQWRAALNQHLAVNPQYGGFMGFKKRSFLIDCMKAKGYEVAQ